MIRMVHVVAPQDEFETEATKRLNETDGKVISMSHSMRGEEYVSPDQPIGTISWHVVVDALFVLEVGP